MNAMHNEPLSVADRTHDAWPSVVQYSGWRVCRHPCNWRSSMRGRSGQFQEQVACCVQHTRKKHKKNRHTSSQKHIEGIARYKSQHTQRTFLMQLTKIYLRQQAFDDFSINLEATGFCTSRSSITQVYHVQ